MIIDLTPWLNHMPAWLLVLFRLTGLFLFAPMLGGVAIPMRIKAMLALGLSFCIYPALLWSGTPSQANLQMVIGHDLSLWSLGPMIAMELAIGAVLGLGAVMPVIGLQMGGRVMDLQLGLGAAGLFNPELGEESGIISEFLFMFAVAVFVIMGGHLVLFKTLISSFDHIPLGGFSVNAKIIDLMVGLLSVAFDLAIRIAAPILCMMFLVSIAMGFLQKTVPQLNILSIGFALRIVVGAGVLIAGVWMLSDTFVNLLPKVLTELDNVIGRGEDFTLKSGDW